MCNCSINPGWSTSVIFLSKFISYGTFVAIHALKGGKGDKISVSISLPISKTGHLQLTMYISPKVKE